MTTNYDNKHGSTLSNSAGFLKFIAYLQIIGIILVVLGHSFHQYPLKDDFINDFIHGKLATFRMPVFMFVSGFLMYYTTYIKNHVKSVPTFLREKLNRLIIPFIVLCTITFIPRVMIGGLADESIRFSLKSLLESFTYQDKIVIPTLWFLQSSFTLLIITYLVLGFLNKLNVREDITLISLVIIFSILYILYPFTSTFLSINKTMELGIYFVLGVCYSRYYKIVDHYIPWENIFLLLIFISGWLITYEMFALSGRMIICSLFGIAMCISFAKILVKYNARFLDHLIGANYIIFLLSWYFNILTQQVLSHYVVLPWYIHTILSLISGIYIPWLFYKYMCKHPHGKLAKFSTRFLGQRF